MDEAERLIHLQAGKAYGKERTCGSKVNYRTEGTATKSAEKMSLKQSGDLEAYPCFWCNGWHIGRSLTPEERQQFTDEFIDAVHVDVDVLLKAIGPQSEQLENWVGSTEAPSVIHPRVARSDGGGLCPEQHYGVLTDGRSFYFRYRHGSASLQVLDRPPGVYDLPVVNPFFDREACHIAAEAGTEYTGPPFWAEPVVWVPVSEEDDGFFQDDGEKLDTFSRLLALVDKYDQQLAARDYEGESTPLGQGSPWGPAMKVSYDR